MVIGRERIGDQHAGPTDDSSLRDGGCTGTRDQQVRDTEHGGKTIRAREEQLQVNKTPVQTGEVRVRKEVHTEHQQITVPVEREEVVVERRPVSGHATSGIKAEEIRIPVKEEHVRVSKEAVVKEEVSVGKRKVQDTQTVSGEVRKEEVVVETEGQAKVRQTGKTDKK